MTFHWPLVAGRDRRDADVERSCLGSESHPRRRRHRNQGGFTLVESLVAIAIIGVAVVGIGAAVAATQQVAAVNQDQAQLDLAMRQLSDYVRDSSTSNSARNLPYQTCATSYTIGIAKPTGVTSWGVSAVYASTSGGRNGVSTPPLATCSAGRSDWGVQEIKVFVTDGSRTLTRLVWKSKTW